MGRGKGCTVKGPAVPHIFRTNGRDIFTQHQIKGITAKEKQTLAEALSQLCDGFTAQHVIFKLIDMTVKYLPVDVVKHPAVIERTDQRTVFVRAGTASPKNRDRRNAQKR